MTIRVMQTNRYVSGEKYPINDIKKAYAAYEPDSIVEMLNQYVRIGVDKFYPNTILSEKVENFVQAGRNRFYAENKFQYNQLMDTLIGVNNFTLPSNPEVVKKGEVLDILNASRKEILRMSPVDENGNFTISLNERTIRIKSGAVVVLSDCNEKTTEHWILNQGFKDRFVNPMQDGTTEEVEMVQ